MNRFKEAIVCAVEFPPAYASNKFLWLIGFCILGLYVIIPAECIKSTALDLMD